MVPCYLIHNNMVHASLYTNDIMIFIKTMKEDVDILKLAPSSSIQ